MAKLMGIPFGKRCNLWITFENTVESNPIMLLTLPNNNIITVIQKFRMDKRVDRWQYGTVFFGTFIEQSKTFVIENITKYKGIDVIMRPFIDRLSFILEFVEFYCQTIPNNHHHPINIKVAQIVDMNMGEAFKYKTFTVTSNNATTVTNNVTPTSKKIKKYKPQYKLPTTFKMKARTDEDIYELYAYGVDKNPTFYALAGLNDFKMSLLLKIAFSKKAHPSQIVKNLDYIEMSDDETDDETDTTDADTQKGVFVECVFNDRFNKWFPKRIIGESSIGMRYVSILHL